MQRILDQLRANKPGDRCLDLYGSVIKNEEFKSIAEALMSNTSVKYIRFDTDLIENEEAKSLLEPLRHRASDVVLEIRGNDEIGPVGIEFVTEFIKTDSPIIQFHLTHTHQMTLEEASSLVEAFRTNSSITNLNLSMNALLDANSKIIAELIKHTSSITALKLSYNMIGNEGIKPIAEALKSNSSITKLYLEWNQIGDEGAKVLAEALEFNSTLKIIDLNGNKIGNEGARSLANIVRPINSPVLEIDVGSNKIGYEGAKAVFESHNPSVIINGLLK